MLGRRPPCRRGSVGSIIRIIVRFRYLSPPVRCSQLRGEVVKPTRNLLWLLFFFPLGVLFRRGCRSSWALVLVRTGRGGVSHHAL